MYTLSYTRQHSLGGCRPPHLWVISVGGFAPSPPKKSAFGLRDPFSKANGGAILLLSAKDMICQTGSDILTSCPTYDESACPIYDEKNMVFENKNRLDERTGGWAAGWTVGQAVGRSGGRVIGRLGGPAAGWLGGCMGGLALGRSGSRMVRR